MTKLAASEEQLRSAGDLDTALQATPPSLEGQVVQADGGVDADSQTLQAGSLASPSVESVEDAGSKPVESSAEEGRAGETRNAEVGAKKNVEHVGTLKWEEAQATALLE
jgi:hypothetical protein